MNRMTIVEHAYHQTNGDHPFALTSNFARSLETDEQLFCRRLRVTEEWQPLESWLKQTAMLIVSNDEGKHLVVVPSKEQKDETARKVIEVAMPPYEHPWLVLPGESMRAQPADLSVVRIRSRSGLTNCTVSLFPL